MVAKTHIYGGALIGLGIADIMLSGKISLWSQVGVVIGSISGSLLPDVDCRNSRLQNRHPWLSTKIRNYIVECGFGFGDAKYSDILYQHRGICHSVFMIFPVVVFLLFISLFIPSSYKPFYYFFTLGISSGIISHLFLDLLTYQGVQLFAPFSTKKISFTNMRTGGLAEAIIQKLLLVLIVIMAFITLLFNASILLNLGV